MSEMYMRIEELCNARGIKIGKLCSELNISRGVMSNLKNGSTKQLSAATVQLVADYFSVSTDVIYGREGQKQAPHQW